MPASALPQAAKALGISVPTLRRWLRAGAPQLRRGGRGRGRACLVDAAAIAAWRGRGAVTGIDPLVLAAVIPELVAAATWQAFIAMNGPKRLVAGTLAATWYGVSSALLDHLREIHHDVPEVTALPLAIERLQQIARQ